MTVAAAFDPNSISLTPRAAEKVRELVSEEENHTLKLRVFITGGGCSGFQYGFSFDEEEADDDTRIERDGVTVLVDPMSFPYLAGSEVDGPLVARQGLLGLFVFPDAHRRERFHRAHDGSEVDYTEGLEGSRFIINNPNAVTTCGCGASFSI